MAQQPSDAEESRIVNAIKIMFNALHEENLATFHSVIAPGFYIFDNGVRFDGDAVMGMIKSLHASDKHFEWNITKPDIHVQGNSAWIAYLNDGIIIHGDAKSHQSWLESAFLEKQSGTWKIEFVHSTRVPPTPPQSK